MGRRAHAGEAGRTGPGASVPCMDNRLGTTLLALAAIAAPLALGACEPTNANLTVNTSADGSDAAPGDGVCEMTTGAGNCSLRAAIDESNASAAVELITIAAGVDPVLTIAGAGEDGNATGDLDVIDGCTLEANGAVVDAGGLDRVFDLHGTGSKTFVTLRHVVVSGGDAPGDGGGISIHGYVWFTLEQSTLAHNHASGW